MKLIHLKRGLVAQVSDLDWADLREYTWGVNDDGHGKLYACRWERNADGKWERVYMHRHITKCRKGWVVDHRDANGLNNQRFNLRVATTKNNSHNTSSFGEGSDFKGVTMEKSGRFRARIVNPLDGERIHLGMFKSEEAAARAYDKKALELFGEFAWLNFPADKDPETPTPEEIPFP